MNEVIINGIKYVPAMDNLADVAQVGDYVEYPYEYDFDKDNHKSGFRVIKVENGQVYLISSGGTENFTGENADDLIDKMTQEEGKYIVEKYADFCQFLDEDMLLEMPYKLVRINKPYWLKTKSSSNSYYVMYVHTDGSLYNDNAYYTNPVSRPVIRLKSNVKGVQDNDGVWKLS